MHNITERTTTIMYACASAEVCHNLNNHTHKVEMNWRFMFHARARTDRINLNLTLGTCSKKNQGLKLSYELRKSLWTACPSRASGSELWESTQNCMIPSILHYIWSIASDDGFVLVFGPSQSSFQSRWTQVIAYLCMSSLEKNRELS